MTEAMEMADKINNHITAGGEVWTLSYTGAKGVRKAYEKDGCLWAWLGRSRMSVCLLANHVTPELRKEWRNLRFR